MYSDTADVPPPYTKPTPTGVPGNVSTVSATVVTQPVIVHQVCVYMCMHACAMITCHFSHVLPIAFLYNCTVNLCIMVTLVTYRLL